MLCSALSKTAAEAGLNFAFTIEMVMRMVALGGVLEYLKHAWNIFDCLMVLVGYTAFIPTDSNTSGLRALRAMRALRPLRSITRFEALRSIVVCFFEVGCCHCGTRQRPGCGDAQHAKH